MHGVGCSNDTPKSTGVACAIFPTSSSACLHHRARVEVALMVQSVMCVSEVSCRHLQEAIQQQTEDANLHHLADPGRQGVRFALHAHLACCLMKAIGNFVRAIRTISGIFLNPVATLRPGSCIIGASLQKPWKNLSNTAWPMPIRVHQLQLRVMARAEEEQLVTSFLHRPVGVH